MIFVGSIMPTSPPFDTLVVPIQNALQMALEDFNDETTLPGGQKLGWVGCDSRGSTDLARVAGEHLVEVGVPAMVGPVFSENVIAVAEDVAIPNDIFVITPTATNKDITTLADDDLVWRPIASDVYQANALADRMDAIASQTSTAIVYKDDAYGTDLATDAFAALSGPVAAATTTRAYTVFPDMDDLVDEVGTMIGELLSQPAPPETVVIVGTSEATLIILTYLQVASQINPLLIPQRFIVSHGAVPSMPTTINSVPDDPTKQLLYALMEGVAPIIFDEANFSAFNIRYKVKFNDQEAITTSSLSYDSLMVIGFAMSAIPEGEPITGANIAAQMGKLVDPNGTFINFEGTTFIKTAVNALSVGNTVNLQGVSGGLEFDLETGDVRTDLLGWEAEPIGGNLSQPTIAPQRIYMLNAEPATDGMWFDL